MSSLFGSFSFQQAVADDATPDEPTDAQVEGRALVVQRTTPEKGISVKETLASSSMNDSAKRSPGIVAESLAELTAETHSPAITLHAEGAAQGLINGSHDPVNLDQSTFLRKQSDNPSPTLTPQRKVSGHGLEGKQDSFMTAEEIILPMRSSAHAKAHESYTASSEKAPEDPLSKDSEPSAEATPTSRSPRLRPLNDRSHDDASTNSKLHAEPLSYNPKSFSAQRRSRISHNSHHLPFSAVASAEISSGIGHDTASLGSGSRTAGNSPCVNPSDYRGTPSPLNATFASRESDDGLYSSPHVHHARREAPKETYVADVDVDPISGRKVINQYEIIDELGRGVHGKVKLGRNLNTEEYVAIKIVDRSARRRRLGKTSNPAEKIKREIAILKKARHPNIVSLLEVIDDPAKKKVYIVLEHVEMGEIRWRAEGAKDICLYEYRYTQRELRGETANSTSSRPETEQKQNIPSDPVTSLAQKGEDEPSYEQPFLANSLLDGRELYALKHNTTDYPHGDASPSHQVDNTNGGQRSVPTFGEDKPPSPPANNGTDEEDPSAGSKSNDVCKENSPADIESRNSPHVRSSSRIFDTNATISAANTYNPPAIEDSGIPECFQYVPTMSLPAIREAFRDTVLGLEYLHYQGVIHRDIKPANLLQTREHRVKISDFGVSFLGRQLRENDNDDTTESEAQDFDEGVELAKTVGTPAFFAPELCQTDFDVEPPPVTGQIDVWALGVTLYCLVFGRVPFFHVDTFALMRTIAQDEVYIPRKRLKAVDEINLTHQASFDSRHNSDAAQPISDESIHEAIGGDLYDLIKRLLVKDARKRITLAEVKRHPWILQDVGDPVLWVDQTDPSHQTQGKKIEVSKEDVADAVVPLNIIERVKLEFKRIGGALGLGRSSSRRKRAGSSSVVTDPISFISDMGMLPGGSNRRATEASLGTTTNSKSGHADKRERAYVQDAREASKGSTAREVANKEDYFATAKSLARPSIVEQANDRRISMPVVPIRQRSSVLASNNTRPPPLSDSVKHDGFGSLPAPHEPFNLSGVPEGNSTRSNVIGEPGRRFLRSVRSRERRSHSRLRQGDGQKRSKQELQDQSEHQRAEPSVAFSNTYAEGHVDAVPARRKGSFPAGGSQGSASPRPLSFTLTEQYSSAGGNLSVSRKSSGSSQLSPQKSTDFAVAESPRQRSCFGPSTRRKLSSDKYQQAQDEMIRKMVLEQARFKDAHTSAGRQQKQWTDASFMACPPSPDDNSYGVDHDQAYGQPNAQTSNPNSYASRWHNQYITPSSSDDQFASGVSQSTSNPSIPSVASASSSIIPEEDCKCGRKQTVVRRSSGDTLKTRPRSARIRYSKGGYASGKEPAETDADYHVDADADNDNDTADGNDDDDDDDDDDDNDFIEMSRRRSTGLGQQLGHVYRSKSTAYTKPARRRFPRRSVDDGS